jgi:hypothetical protein
MVERAQGGSVSMRWNNEPGVGFMEALRVQRWDDHRYYHHSRINQTLHLFSASSFVCAGVLVATGHAAVAALLGWIVGMCSRQIGHFFFEPRGFDEINQATDQYKESVKVGYNIRRKIVLMSLWAISPVALYLRPSFFGLLTPHTDLAGFVENLSVIWIWIGIGAALFRTVQLFFVRDVQTGLVWFTKIATDPFHDIWLYHKAPLALLRGELIAPASVSAQAGHEA